MAEPIPFKNANITLKSIHDEILELPAQKENGMVTSCWRLTTPELEVINRTGVIWVSILCRGPMPPQLVTVHNPHPK